MLTLLAAVLMSGYATDQEILADIHDAQVLVDSLVAQGKVSALRATMAKNALFNAAKFLKLGFRSASFGMVRPGYTNGIQHMYDGTNKLTAEDRAALSASALILYNDFLPQP